MSGVTVKQVQTYLKALDGGRIKRRTEMDSIVGLSRLVMAEHARAEAAEQEVARLREALEEALPIVEAVKGVREVSSRMTQPSMGRHPLEDDLDRAEGQLLRLTRSPAKLRMLVNAAHVALSAAETVKT